MNSAISDIMVDVETLGTNPGCAILSLAAVPFDPRSNEPETNIELAKLAYRAEISLESCCAAGLVIEPGAVRFWMAQDDAARAAAFAGKTDIRDALVGFIKWHDALPKALDVNIWSHGAPFDPPILTAAFDTVGLEVPWDFRRLRDTRTVFDMANVTYQGKYHEPFIDCTEQIKAVRYSFGVLGLHRQRSVS